MKYKLLSFFRFLGILKWVDAYKYYTMHIFSWHRNRRFKKENPEFTTPPHDLAFDAFNHIDWTNYRESGIKHANVFARIIQKFCTLNTLNIMEWGCGPGRLIRHMSGLLDGRTVSLTGSDYNTKSIDWCSRNLAGIDFVHNDLLPPLPFSSDSFNVVYNFSVFTHLSQDAQVSWAKELFRILKPGGLMICTTHGDYYRYLLTNDNEQKRYDEGEVIIQGNYNEGKKWFLAIHPTRFVQEVLLMDFSEVQKIETSPEDQLFQDVWVGWKK